MSKTTHKNENRLLDAERLLAKRQISRRQFIATAVATGLTTSAASLLATSTTAIAQTQRYNVENLTDQYDYVVCGAGSAGCVVAAELAKSGEASVLLIEAGGSDDVDGVLDTLWFNIFMNPDFYWVFNGEPETQINNRSPLLPMGRVVGGGSSVNALVYARGHKADYDGWAAQLGDEKWSYENVLNIYRDLEHFEGPQSALRGQGGRLWTELPSEVHEIAVALKGAGAAFGIPAVDDVNAETMERDAGIGHPNVIVKDGQRHNIARAFLYPVLAQPNITVLTGAQVEKVLFEGDQATGVELVWQGERRRISAGRHTILSAGALKTPQLLMVSGVGEAEHLAEHGIEVVSDLPGVGRNFQDHPLVAGCMWEYRNPIPPVGTGSQCVFFANVNSEAGAPDIMPVQLQIPFASEVHGQRDDIPAAAWTIVPGLAKPRSRGRVTLASANPNDAPITHTGFLSDPHDVETLLRGIELVRDIGNSSEMSSYVAREVMPGPVNADEMTDFIRNGVATYYHMAGTAKMGSDSDPMAVVDSNLAVRGTRGLSIADTSVMPDIPRGNTMAPAAMVGYQLARQLQS